MRASVSAIQATTTIAIAAHSAQTHTAPAVPSVTVRDALMGILWSMGNAVAVHALLVNTWPSLAARIV